MLLIDEEFALARVIVALVCSMAFLTSHLAIKPFKRAEDGALTLAVEQALILVYTCVLLIKTCNISAEVCVTYGFGESAKGV